LKKLYWDDTTSEKKKEKVEEPEEGQGESTQEEGPSRGRLKLLPFSEKKK